MAASRKAEDLRGPSHQDNKMIKCPQVVAFSLP